MIFLRSVGNVKDVSLHEDVVVGRSDVDGSRREPLPVDHVHRAIVALVAQEFRQDAGLRAHVLHDADRSGE